MRWDTNLAVKTLTLAIGAVSLGAASQAYAACSWKTVSTFSSGNTPTSVLAPGGTTPIPAYTVAPDSGYYTLPGTSWINYNPDTSGTTYAWASYYVDIFAPYEDGDASGVRAKIEVNADNVAWFYLNDTKVYEQSWGEVASNFQSPAESAWVYDFIPGDWNQMRIDVYNFSGPTALNYRITLQQFSCTETCPASYAGKQSQDPSVIICPAN
jgi:hypothetical protein